MQSAPKVSVIVPTFNMGQFVGRTIRSYLEQSERDIEVIVSDNASTDNTASVVKSIDDPRVRYFCNSSNIGMMNNFNAGLRHARGQFITFVAADEFALGEKSIECRLDLVRREPDVDYIWCGFDFENEDDDGRIYAYEMSWPEGGQILPANKVLEFLLTRINVINPRITTVMFRREILAALNYRLPLVHGGDQLVSATWLLHSRKAAYVKEVLHRSYIHSSHRHVNYGRQFPYIGEGPLLMLNFIDESRPRLIAMRFPIVRAELVQLYRLARLISHMPDFEFDNFWHYTSLFIRRSLRLMIFCAWAPPAWVVFVAFKAIRWPFWWLRRRLASNPLARKIYSVVRRRNLRSGATRITPLT
jgi:glycosyltransferase involved in cell wall biosynthesis